MLRDSTSNHAAARVPTRRYRTIFISDLHLGSPGCKAECLQDFLRHVESEYLYLVGDVVDGWRLRKRWFWPERHNQILHGLLERARRGTRAVYLPGNHDEALRRLIGSTLGGVRFLPDAIHLAADGRRLLVLHGDAFDGVCKDIKWPALLGRLPLPRHCGQQRGQPRQAAPRDRREPIFRVVNELRTDVLVMAEVYERLKEYISLSVGVTVAVLCASVL